MCLHVCVQQCDQEDVSDPYLISAIFILLSADHRMKPTSDWSPRTQDSVHAAVGDSVCVYLSVLHRKTRFNRLNVSPTASFILHSLQVAAFPLQTCAKLSKQSAVLEKQNLAIAAFP